MAMLNPTTESGTDAVPAGYKRTEVGIIPEDWEVKRLGDIVTYIKGYPFKSNEYVSDGIRVIRVSDILGDIILDVNPIFISNAKYWFYSRWIINENDILINTVGSKPPIYSSMVGKAIIVKKRYAGSLLNQNLVLLHNKSKKVCIQEILINHLRTTQYTMFIESIYRGNANQASITLNELFQFHCSFPTKYKEQQAIAEALSDTDALITALDRLIAKKRAIKQATMQQLLTGKTRLPGFDGEWEQKILGDVIERIIGGGTPSRTIPTYWNGDIPWVTVKDFTSFDPYSAQEYITKQGFINSATNLILAGNLIIATRMALGKAVVYEVDVCINQDLKALILKKEQVFVHYLYYWFEKNAHTIDEIGSGSTVKGLSINDLRSMLINVPSIDEQHAIATVLSDMDAELDALEQRRAKTIQIKQGMMQQLLTGRIRLCAPLAEEDA